MTLDAILPPERTLFDVPGGSKKRVLEFFSTFIAQNTPSLDSQEVFSRLIGRERLGSTGIGNGVAIPHARNPHCKAPIAGFLKLAEPVDFAEAARGLGIKKSYNFDEFAATEDPADYSVNVLTVEVGTTVTWTNDDAILHTVTATDGAFDSGFFGEGERWSYTFDEPGEYEYYCVPHPWMRAKVVVEG